MKRRQCPLPQIGDKQQRHNFGLNAWSRAIYVSRCAVEFECGFWAMTQENNSLRLGMSARLWRRGGPRRRNCSENWSKYGPNGLSLAHALRSYHCGKHGARPEQPDTFLFCYKLSTDRVFQLKNNFENSKHLSIFQTVGAESMHRRTISTRRTRDMPPTPYALGVRAACWYGSRRVVPAA